MYKLVCISTIPLMLDMRGKHTYAAEGLFTIIRIYKNIINIKVFANNRLNLVFIVSFGCKISAFQNL